MAKPIRKYLPAGLRQQLGQMRYQFSCLSKEFGAYRHNAASDLPEKQRFLIFGQGRSGTTLLQSLLNNSPEVYCEGELLSKKHQFYGKRLYNSRAFIQGISKKHHDKVFGFHAKIYQLTEHQSLDAQKFLQELVATGWKILYLRRQDPIRHAMSTIIADHRKGYESTKSVDLNPIEVEVEKFRSLVVGRLRYRMKEMQALKGSPYLSLTYENDLEHHTSHQATADRVFDYLGLPSVQVQSELKRINTYALKDLVLNYDDLLLAIEDVLPSEYHLENPLQAPVNLEQGQNLLIA